mmetsp:Transcript_4540/g.10920  ORF Transcript_4540/g.10920 Transcript_4540/m.10920 type:complete len:434 (-) Transcript_4540:50-1351(-)
MRHILSCGESGGNIHVNGRAWRRIESPRARRKRRRGLTALIFLGAAGVTAVVVHVLATFGTCCIAEVECTAYGPCLLLRLRPDGVAVDDGYESRSAPSRSRPHHTLPPPPDNRIRELDPNGTFSFVHISKAAGSSWIASLQGLPLEKVCPKRNNGAEFSVEYQTRTHCNGSDYHMVSLRSPRHHVWSLFTMCKYSDWGRNMTNGTAFPRSGTAETDDERDFEAFLDHFLPLGGEGTVDEYKCYHPANYQSRHLDVRGVKKPHGVRDLPHDEYRFEPNLNHSLSVYRDQDFVPVVELFHESSCLLYHRLGPRAPARVLRYLDQRCRCPQPEIREGGEDVLELVHITHHALGHRQDLQNLPQSILDKVAILTRVDRELYLVALGEILAEVAWLESPAGLGRRVLCDEAIEKLEPELAYLDRSFANLYRDTTDKLS